LIPYLPQPVLEVAGLTFHAFGTMVALALLVGCWIFVQRARSQHLDLRFAKLFIVSVAGVGYFASHVINVIIFTPGKLVTEPLVVLNPAQGIYSFGGLVGGIVTATWLMRRNHIPLQDCWRYFDNLAFAFTFGWIFGRTGCALAHDHIGIRSNSLLAIAFPGGSRYDLGLLELIFTILLAALFVFLDRRPRPAGLFLGLFFFTYGLFRVLRHTLEVADQQFRGLSPDWLFAIGCVLAGGFILIMRFRPHSQVLAPSAARPKLTLP
jgi:phosphatidylglycerol:prolipoprotein diacylglycerol transferase